MDKEIAEALWEQSRQNRRAGNARMYHFLNRLKAGTGSITDSNVSSMPYQITSDLIDAFLSFYGMPPLTKEQAQVIQYHNQKGAKLHHHQKLHQHQQQHQLQQQELQKQLRKLQQQQQREEEQERIQIQNQQEMQKQQQHYKPKTHITNRYTSIQQKQMGQEKEHENPLPQSVPQSVPQSLPHENGNTQNAIKFQIQHTTDSFTNHHRHSVSSPLPHRDTRKQPPQLPDLQRRPREPLSPPTPPPELAPVASAGSAGSAGSATHHRLKNSSSQSLSQQQSTAAASELPQQQHRYQQLHQEELTKELLRLQQSQKRESKKRSQPEQNQNTTLSTSDVDPRLTVLISSDLRQLQRNQKNGSSSHLPSTEPRLTVRIPNGREKLQRNGNNLSPTLPESTDPELRLTVQIRNRLRQLQQKQKNLSPTLDPEPGLTDQIKYILPPKVKQNDMHPARMKNAEELVLKSRTLKMQHSKQLYEFILAIANGKRPKDEGIISIMDKYDLSTYDVQCLFELYAMEIKGSIIPNRDRSMSKDKTAGSLSVPAGIPGTTIATSSKSISNKKTDPRINRAPDITTIPTIQEELTLTKDLTHDLDVAQALADSQRVKEKELQNDDPRTLKRRASYPQRQQRKDQRSSRNTHVHSPSTKKECEHVPSKSVLNSRRKPAEKSNITSRDDSLANGRFNSYDDLLYYAIHSRTTKDRKLYDAVRSVRRGLIPKKNFQLLIDIGLTQADINKIRKKFGFKEASLDDLFLPDGCTREGAGGRDGDTEKRQQQQEKQLQTKRQSKATNTSNCCDQVISKAKKTKVANGPPIPERIASSNIVMGTPAKEEPKEIGIKVLDTAVDRTLTHPVSTTNNSTKGNNGNKKLQIPTLQKRKRDSNNHLPLMGKVKQWQQERKRRQQLQSGPLLHPRNPPTGEITSRTVEKVREVRDWSSAMRSEGNRQLYDILNKIIRGYKPSARAYVDYGITIDMVNYLRNENSLKSLPVEVFPYFPEQVNDNKRLDDGENADEDDDNNKVESRDEDQEKENYVDGEEEEDGEDEHKPTWLKHDDHASSSLRKRTRDTKMRLSLAPPKIDADHEKNSVPVSDSRPSSPGTPSRTPSVSEPSECRRVTRPIDEESSELDMQIEDCSDEAHDGDASESEIEGPIDMENVSSFRTEQFLFAIQSMLLHQKMREKMKKEENMST